MRLLSVLALLFAACARPAPRDAAVAPAARATAASFDSATAHRLCAAPDSARAARGGCELRDQGVLRTFRVP